MKRLESSTEETTGAEDSVSTVPVIAEDSVFADSCEYVVQLETEFPVEPRTIDEAEALRSPAEPDIPVRKAA